jgi:hypothetical protein
MKNPEKFPWKNHLPEHLPKENLWEKILAKKSLDGQVRDLKSQLPLSYPKEDLWIDIEKSLNKRKTIELWSRVVSVAAALVVGLWGTTALFNTPTRIDTIYLTTEISQDFGKYTPEIQPITTPKTEEGKKAEINSQKSKRPFKAITKIDIPELDSGGLFQVEIPLPEIFFAEVDRRTKNIDEFSDTTYQGKKTIAITWDKQPKRIKIDGFQIELTERESQVLRELENRKNGKFNVHINALTARLYEK